MQHNQCSWNVLLMLGPELEEKQKKLVAFNSLVHRLPRPNLALLRALARFLIAIVNNSDVNKMNIRNVGIVFAPTLNIPAPIFLTFLTDYNTIFGEPPGSGMQSVPIEVSRSVSAQDIRSPHRQIFSDMTTPSYNQTSFRTQESLRGVREDDLSVPHGAGLTTMQPGYEQSQRPGEYSQGNMLSADTGATSKAKRRESSFLLLDGKQPRSSVSPARDKSSERIPAAV